MSDSSGEPSPQPASCSTTLAELYAEDFEEHADVPPVGSPEYRALRERDRRRRQRAADLLVSLEASGTTSAEDLYHAHGSSTTATSRQRREPATTDEERAAWDVPPLAEQLRRADELTRSEPQPPMDEAPAWLRAANDRWASEGSEVRSLGRAGGLPFIDVHRIWIAAPRGVAWTALEKYVAGFLRRVEGGLLTRLLGAVPRAGFEIAERVPPDRLTLTGRHRFARYRLAFDLAEVADGGTDLRATTHGEFPGLHGRAYRALVIGTGAHVVATTYILRSIRRRATIAADDPPSNRR